MAALDHRALDREADADFDLPTEALGRMTLVSELGEDGGAEEGALGALTEAPPSQGPAAPEPPFNIHALAGNGGMAAAVLEQPAAAIGQ